MHFAFCSGSSRRTSLFLIPLIAASVLFPCVFPQEASADEALATIVLDPGHGGLDTGAAANGLVESDLNWKICMACKEALEADGRFVVYVSRKQNEYIGVNDRPVYAQSVGADLLLSIHCNSAAASSVNGYEIYIPYDCRYFKTQTYDVAYPLASLISGAFNALDFSHYGSSAIRTRLSDDQKYPDGSIADYYGVIRGSRLFSIPSLIVEHGYVTGESDKDLLADDEFLTALGKADAQAIIDYYSNLGFTISQRSVKASEPLSFRIFGDFGLNSGVKFNYVWRSKEGWNRWGSFFKSNGCYTSSASYSINAPDTAGEYLAWADFVYPDGSNSISRVLDFSVWDLVDDGIEGPDIVYLGNDLSYSVDTVGPVSNIRFNYVWSYEGLWGDNWDSTLKRTATYTSDKSFSFTPDKAGTYHIWIDIIDELTGNVYESEKLYVQVVDKPHLVGSGVVAPEDIALGQSLSFSPDIQGNTSGLSFNYAWSYEGMWGDNWDSTLKRTGKLCNELSYTFTPKIPGTYYLWIDVRNADGETLTTDMQKVGVGKQLWDCSGIDVPSRISLGDCIEYSLALSGCTSSLKYNFAWSYQGKWDTWDSTLKRTGSYSSGNSYSFYPKTPGIYYVWADVKDKYGRSLTTDWYAVEVLAPQWEFDGLNCPANAKVGESLSFSAAVSGDTSKLSYNFAWSYEGLWGDNWDSVLKSSGKMSSVNSYTFTPSKSGTYYLWADVKDAFGASITCERYALEVSDTDWCLSGLYAVSSSELGVPISFNAIVSGDTSGLSYNFAWSYEGLWGDNWDSTLKSSGKMSEVNSYRFTPTKAGCYYIWADVKDSKGNSVTCSRQSIRVYESQWSLNGLDAPLEAFVNDELTFSPSISGSCSTLSFNYAWSYEGHWGDDWDSTVKRTGSMCSDKSYSFCPRKAGSYFLWIDVRDASGKTVTSQTYTVNVISKPWELQGVSASGNSEMGLKLQMSADLKYAPEDLDYLFQYRYGSTGSWSNADECKNGSISFNGASFVPDKAGTWFLRVIVSDANGRTVTSDSYSLNVSEPVWAVGSFLCPASVNLGSAVDLSLLISGNPYGLSYNFVWRYGDGWELWDSCMKGGKAASSSPSYSFIPPQSGTYEVWVNVFDVNGDVVDVDSRYVVVKGTPITGSSQATVEQMASTFNASGFDYDSVFYSQKGAASIEDFCQIVFEEAEAEGIRAEVVFAQSMHETGWLQFGNLVSIEQCNFCGLGATGPGYPGASFDDVRSGIRAQVQHLKAYASKDALVNECIDPRFNYVTRGIAPYLEDLNGRWAVPGTYYGQMIKAIIDKVLEQ